MKNNKKYLLPLLIVAVLLVQSTFACGQSSEIGTSAMMFVNYIIGIIIIAGLILFFCSDNKNQAW